MNLFVRSKGLLILLLFAAAIFPVVIGNAQDKSLATTSVGVKEPKRTYFFGLGIYQIYARSRKNGVLHDVVAIVKGKTVISAGFMSKDKRRANHWSLRAGSMLISDVSGKKPKIIRMGFEDIVLDEKGQIVFR